MATYVVSDIHGYYDVFLSGLQKISFNDEDTLFVIGDGIDRGPDGIKVLRHIKEQENMDLIIGNHELMMLNSVDPNGEDVCCGNDTSIWLFANGGNTTYEEYCKLPLETRRDLLIWLKTRYVTKILDLDGWRICLSHSFYSPSCENKKYHELSYSDVSHITWTSIWREDDYTHGEDIYANYEYTFITGHVPVQRARRWVEQDKNWNTLKMLFHDNLINIDGGCAFGYDEDYNNGAIFLRIDDMEVFTVEMK